MTDGSSPLDSASPDRRHPTDGRSSRPLANDPLALKVIREAAAYLGTAVAGLLNLMNPAAVILGGDLSRLGELLLAPLRERVHSRTLVSSVAAAEILVSKLGPQSVAVGAATLVLKTGLGDSRLFPPVEKPAKSSAGSSGS